MSTPFGRPVQAESIPAELKAIPRWLLWRLEDRNGKPSKMPYQADGRPAKVNDPTTWTDFNTALAAYLAGGWSGLGIALAEDDDLTGVDLDKCLNPDTGELDLEAAGIVAMMPTYCEVSPSGRGLRLFAFGKLPQGGRRKGKVEMYESGRYLTVTGNRFNGHDSIAECTAELAAVHARIFGADSPPVAAKPADPPNLDDATLLDKARRARNGADFERLWSGDLSAHGGDHSAADLALCNLLSFWTGGDPARTDRLFRQSALFRPAKWDKAHFSDGRTYGQATLDKAMAGNRETYSGTRPAGAEPGPAGAGVEVNDAQLARLFQTDLGNSERLVARHGRDLHYCFDFGKWLCWDGVRWAIDRNGDALDKAKDTARAMLAEAATLADREDARKLAAWSFKSQARERLAAALFLAQPDVSVLPEQLDTRPWLLNVANGTVDLRSGQLRPADRADLLTKSAPVVYDPAAKCEQWLAFLDRIFAGNQEIIRYVQKAAGYSLTGLDTEECFFVLHGTGQNGKSTVVETLSALLGTDYAQQATPDLLMQKKQERHATELAVLRGARLVASVETGQGKRLNEVLIKSMTGGDRIRANFMHQDTFEFRPEFKVWLSTNHKPVITGTDLGIWRRIRLIPFAVKIPDEERDGAFKARLREPAALAGILNWAIQGALLWQREGLKPPQEVSDATQAYREEMDVLAAWISDCCVVNKRAEAKAADLYASYTGWCDAQGEKPESQRSFGLRLTERGLDRRRGTAGAHRWFGIGLLAPSDVSDPSDPESDIKDTNSGEGFKNVRNRVTSVTSVTIQPDDAFSSHLGDASQPVDCGNSANRQDFRERKPPAGAGYEPVDNLQAGAGDDARQLWAVLKHVQGSEPAVRLAQKLGWNEARVKTAALELREGYKRATISGAFIAPLHPNEAVF
ncbi:hypothetical protein GEOBC_01554 [Geobacteraceae bacterium]|nr:hypothetical protein GEOBC_01554 [Geobacteraceae bacterium]